MGGTLFSELYNRDIVLGWGVRGGTVFAVGAVVTMVGLAAILSSSKAIDAVVQRGTEEGEVKRDDGANDMADGGGKANYRLLNSCNDN